MTQGIDVSRLLNHGSISLILKKFRLFSSPPSHLNFKFAKIFLPFHAWCYQLLLGDTRTIVDTLFLHTSGADLGEKADMTAFF